MGPFDFLKKPFDAVLDAVDTVFDSLGNLFIPETEVFFNLNIQRVIEDEKLTNTTEESVIKAILDKDRDIVNELTKGHLNGTIRDFEKFNQDVPVRDLFPDIDFFINKEEAKNIPDKRSKLFSDQVHLEEVVKQIEAEENTSVIIDYYRYRGLNFQHLTKQMLNEKFNWNFDDRNVIGTKAQEKGFDVFLDAVRFEVSNPLLPNNSRFNNSIIGRPFSKFRKPGDTQERTRNNPNILADVVFFTSDESWVIQGINEIDTDDLICNAEVGFVWRTEVPRGKGSLEGETFKIDLTTDPNFIKNRDTIMVKYHYFDSNDKRVTKYWTYVPGRGVFPDIDNIKPKSTDIFDNRFPLVKFRERGERVINSNSDTKLGIQKYLADTLGFDYDELDKSIHETENINEVNNVFMGMTVPLNSSNPAEIEYLFRYFKRIGNDINIIPEFEPAAINDELSQKSIFTKIGSADHQLTFNSVELRNKSGNENKKGTYSSKTEEVTRTLQFINDNGKIDSGEFTFKVKVFQYQKTDSVFEEVRILNPAVQWEFEEADAGDVPLTGPDNEQTIVFIDEAISKDMNLQTRETLYLRSLHLIFTSSKEVKQKWYQTGIFKFALAIVSVTLIVFSFGTASPFVAGAYASLGIAGAVLAVAAIIIGGFVFNLVVEQIVELVGGDIGRILAGVTAIASFAYAYGAGGFSQSFNAQFLLAASSNLVNASNAEFQEQFQDVQDDFEKFLDRREEKLEQLKESETILNSDNLIDAGFFRRRKPAYLQSETPDQFFQRTIHSGNIGTLAFDAQENYVDLMLQLPSLDSNPIDTIKI